MKTILKLAIPALILVAAAIYFRPIIFPTPHSLPPIHYRLTLTDAETAKPVQGAIVELAGATSTKSATSEPDGIVRFEFPPSKDFLNAKLNVRAQGFEFVNRELKFPPQDYGYSVVLKPLGAPIGSSLLKDRKPYTRFYSREIAAGRGSEFSPMIELGAEPPQPGYEIDLNPAATRFSLSGDRSCGAWSECSWKEHDPQRVVFQFRVQGHSEWIFAGPAFSQGILQVQYNPTTLHVFIHGRPGDLRILKIIADKLAGLPYTTVSVETDYAGEETRLEYFSNNTEAEAKSLREAICETLGQPFGWLPVRSITTVRNEKNFFGLWIEEAPK